MKIGNPTRNSGGVGTIMSTPPNSEKYHKEFLERGGQILVLEIVYFETWITFSKRNRFRRGLLRLKALDLSFPMQQSASKTDPNRKSYECFE